MNLPAIGPNFKWYLAFVLLSTGLVIATVMVHRVWTDLKGGADEETTDPDDLLGPLSEAFAAGQMTEEEYNRIRESIRRGVPYETPADLANPRLPVDDSADRTSPPAEGN
jgi:hypothetical protein